MAPRDPPGLPRLNPGWAPWGQFWGTNPGWTPSLGPGKSRSPTFPCPHVPIPLSISSSSRGWTRVAEPPKGNHPQGLCKGMWGAPRGEDVPFGCPHPKQSHLDHMGTTSPAPALLPSWPGSDPVPPTPSAWGCVSPEQPQLALLGSFLPNSASNRPLGGQTLQKTHRESWRNVER